MFISSVPWELNKIMSEWEKWKNGSLKVGLKAIQRDEISYEFTIVFDIDYKTLFTASKDRTNLFEGNLSLLIQIPEEKY
jgi:hypothetical protein